MNMSGEKAKDFKGTMKRLIEYLSPHKATILVVIIFAIASSAFCNLWPQAIG